MLRKALLFCLLVGTATVDSAWGPDRQYVYNVKGRSVTALHQVADHYVGIMIKAQLAIEPTSFQQFRGKLSDAMFAQINMAMPAGWDQQIPDRKLQWQRLPMIGRTFEMTHNNGKVRKMIVSGSTKEWEVNMLKGILSSLQVNAQGVRSISNSASVNGSTNAVFKEMESTVTGECEVGYDIAPLPALVALDQPELAPLANATADNMFDIVKTQNFGKCKQRRAFHFGLTGFENFEPGRNKMGSFMSRSSLTRVVVSGSLKNFTIQSSVTTNKVLVSPEIFNSQQGMSASRINLTLVSISQRKHIPALENPRNAGDLVYRYNNPFGNNSLEQGEEVIEIGESDGAGLSSSNRYRRSIKQQGSSPESQSSSSTSNESDKNEDNNEGSSSESSSSSSSSSEEDLYQTKPQNGSSTYIPLLPFFIGQQGNAVNYSKYIDPVQSVIHKAIRIGSDLQNASSIPVKNTLARFSILTRLIRIMNQTQLEKVTSSLYTPEPPITLHASYNVSVWRKSWKAFRDAVSEAGTLSALTSISSWIRSNKIREEEAAQVVAVLPRTAITPNYVYLKIFSEMVKNNSTRKQNYLNSTAVLSLANLIRKVAVNSVSSHDNYPVHVFGEMVPKNMSIVIGNCTAYLANSLSEAIHANDSQKSQVFIRAFGNIAHPKILQYLKPYLEGRKNATNFQRLLMVVALDKMAKVYPEEARRVLYKIYQNVGELHEIRCASVFLLMKTNPPVTMLQRMAEFTHSDPNLHVISAVKSAIESAANLKGPAALQLSRNAKAAVNLLNPKEMDIGYSRSILKNHRVKDMSLGYLQSFNYIGSTDSIIPNSVFVNIIRDLGGSRNEYVNFAGMVSSVQDAVELLKEQFQNKTEGNENNRSHKSSKKSSASYRRPSSGNWTYNLVDLLNITHDQANRVEGNMLFNFAGAERFFAFDSTVMKDIPRVVKEMAKNSIRPRAINFTKLYNEHTVILSFPNAMGLPTLFTLETPTLLQVGAQVHTRSHPDLARGSNNSVQIPQTINITADVQFVYSTRKESKIGFITPFDSMRYIAGLDRNFQVNLPVRASVNVNVLSSHIKTILQPINSTANHAILHWSALPYTAKHNILSMKPANEGENATVIHVRPTKSVHMTVGQDTTGMAFNIRSETDLEFVDMKWLFNLLQSHDMVSAIHSAWMMKGINYCNSSIIYNARKSIARIFQFSAAYGNNAFSSSKNKTWEAAMDADSEMYGKQHKKSRSRYKRNSRHGIYAVDDESDEEQEEGEWWVIQSSNPANATTKSPDSHVRRQEFLTKAAAATGNGYASVIDVSMAYVSRSTRKALLVATAAYSTSKVNGSSSLLIFVDAKPASSLWNMTKLQISLSANASMSQAPFLSFHQALKANPNSSLMAKLNIDQNNERGAQVTVKATMQRSEEKKQSVVNSPMAHLCEEQMADENYFLPACRNVTEEASNLDQLHMWVKLNNLPDSWKNMTYKAYALARQWAFPQVTENIFPPHTNRDVLKMDVKLNSNSSAFNVSIESSLMDVTFTNIRLPPWARPIVEINPQHSALNRLSRIVSPIFAFPTCVIDGESIRTFDNKTYSSKLHSCWHVMMKYTPKSKRYSLQEVAVLVRGNLFGSEKALMILLGKTTINMTTSFTQAGVHFKVTVNGTVLDYDELHPAKFYVDGVLIMQLFALPDDRVYFTMPNNNLKILFDGRRVILEASNQYRHQVRGLCGTMDGEPITDFKTPKGCIVKDPHYFAASYAITNYSCEGWARKLKASLSAQPCVSQRVSYTDLISNSSRTDGRVYGAFENGGHSSPPSSSSSSSSESASSSESTGSNSSSESGSVESTSKSSWRSNSRSEVTEKYKSSLLHPDNYPSQSCTVHRTKVIEDEGEICFSMGPLPECSPQCNVAQELRKPIRFHCLPKGPTADHWSGMINTGVNPDFSQKRHHKIIQVLLPIRCMSNALYGKQN